MTLMHFQYEIKSTKHSAYNTSKLGIRDILTQGRSEKVQAV